MTLTVDQLAERAVVAYWQDKRTIELSPSEADDFRKMFHAPGFAAAWDAALWRAVEHLGTSMPKWGSHMAVKVKASSSQEGVASE